MRSSMPLTSLEESMTLPLDNEAVLEIDLRCAVEKSIAITSYFLPTLDTVFGEPVWRNCVSKNKVVSTGGVCSSVRFFCEGVFVFCRYKSEAIMVWMFEKLS